MPAPLLDTSCSLVRSVTTSSPNPAQNSARLVPKPPSVAERPLHDPFSRPPPHVSSSIACSLNRMAKERAILQFLQENAGMCILHIITGGDASHHLYECPIFSQFSPPYRTFRSSIRFSKTGICYRCGVLTSDRFQHPNRQKNDSLVCKFDDILKPLAFAVYSIPLLKNQVLSEAGVSPENFANPHAFAQWLGGVRSALEGMFNLWEVCHAFIHLFKSARYIPLHYPVVLQ